MMSTTMSINLARASRNSATVGSRFSGYRAFSSSIKRSLISMAREFYMKWLFIILLSSPALAQVTLVQHGGNNSSSASTLSMSSAFASVAAGDDIVVYVASGSNTATINIPTDTAGDTFVQCPTGSPQSLSAWGKLACYTKVSTAGGSSFNVTATMTTGESSLIVLDLGNSAAVDLSAGKTGTSSAPSVTIIPTTATGTVIAAALLGATVIETAGTNYVLVENQPSNGDFSTHAPLSVVWRQTAPSGSQSALFGSSAASWGAIAVAVLVKVGAATSGNSMLAGPGMVGGPSQVQ